MIVEEVRVCPVCGQKEFAHHLTVKDFTTTGEIFNIQRCTQCKLLVTSPRPDEKSIGTYYQSAQYISHTGGNSSLLDKVYRAVRQRTLRSKLQLINQYQQKLNLLDYGCGTGEFLATCKDAGWSVTGVEPSEEARKNIRKDIPVFDKLQTVTTPVNAITMWHVLEHVHKLDETLAKLRSLLTNNGTIFIAVPNPESYDATTYKEYWAGYDVPRHLWHFNKYNLKELLNKHNLRLKAIEPMRYDAYYVSLLSEKYKRPDSSSLLRTASALTNGMISNLKAGKENYSSLIYIAGS